jgi:hypothetical protein
MAGRPVTRREALAEAARWAGAAATGAVAARSLRAAPPLDPSEDAIAADSWRLVESCLPPRDSPWQDSDAQRILRREGVRAACYMVAGLLARDADDDRRRAASLLDGVLALQRLAPGRPEHGGWPRGTATPRVDPNWREFVGMGLAVVRAEYAERLPDPLRKRVDAALVLAAEGSARRDPPTAYSNVALMSVLLCDAAAAAGRRPDLAERALRKAEKLLSDHAAGDGLAEFNSPTYYGVDLMALAAWRRCAGQPELRRQGAELEARLWRDVAEFFHGELRNLCGPYWRAHGLDMTAYDSALGVVMAAAGVPAAPTLSAPQSPLGDRIYAPLAAMCPSQISSAIRAQLADPQPSRRVERRVLAAGGPCEATALVRPEWMAGAARGMDAHGDERYPATLHWRDPDGGQVGWLAVRGGRRQPVDAALDGQSLVLQLSPSARATELVATAKSSAASPAELAGDRWRLSGREVEVETSLAEPRVVRKTDSKLGEVVEVRWRIPPGHDARKPLAFFRLPRD